MPISPDCSGPPESAGLLCSQPSAWRRSPYALEKKTGQHPCLGLLEPAVPKPENAQFFRCMGSRQENMCYSQAIILGGRYWVFCLLFLFKYSWLTILCQFQVYNKWLSVFIDYIPHTVKHRKIKSLPQGHTVTAAVQPNKVWLQRQGVCKHILFASAGDGSSLSVRWAVGVGRGGEKGIRVPERIL